MITIGITGGVGAGKSEILKHIESRYRSCVRLSDDIAKHLEEPGNKCHDALVRLLGRDVLEPDGRICKPRMAEMIFGSEELRIRVNAILHPAVKDYVLRDIDACRRKERIDIYVLEAALLIEEHYDEILDELWYIYASEETRRNRLKAARGYSDEKIDSIMLRQLSENAFRASCDVTIVNDGDLSETCKQIDECLQSRGVYYAEGK